MKEMDEFEKAYVRLCSRRKVSKGLTSLLEDVYRTLHEAPTNLARIKRRLVSLLSFLCEPENRTDENCQAVDLFFAIHDHWNISWDRYPEQLKQLLDDIGGCLHDTVEAPEIAANFESTPEQLLSRAKKLNEFKPKTCQSNNG